MPNKTTVTTSPTLQKGDIVRRYMNLPKYLDILCSKTLYMNRADRFSDPFEGALTPIMRSTLDKAYAKGELSYDADYFYRRSRMGNFVNCWSLGADDNMALWQLYGGLKNSIVITSTIYNLVKISYGWKCDVLIKKVNYIDHFENPDMIVLSYYDMLCFKHKAYSYEREVRIIVPKQQDGWEQNPNILRLPIADLNSFIQSVTVAPEAGTWFYELVEDVTRKYGLLSTPIEKSKLTALAE